MTYQEWIESYVARQPNGFVRGKCKEACEEMVKAFPELRLAAGFAHVTWGEDQHWWCVAPDGTVVDPTKSQFQLGVVLEYEEMDLKDPKTRLRIPIGKCPNCGDLIYPGGYSESICSERCEKDYVRYLNSPEGRGY